MTCPECDRRARRINQLAADVIDARIQRDRAREQFEELERIFFADDAGAYDDETEWTHG